MDKTDKQLFSISRDEGTKLKGIAILCIAVHNFVHTFGYAIENEFTFKIENWESFLNIISHPDSGIIYHLFSFLGWSGVPIFVFLTGYGLGKKYESTRIDGVNTKTYIWRNWKKLFFLMLPAVCFYIILNFIKGEYGGCVRVFMFLTELNNLIVWINPFKPGVYWYFGLAFQLYVVYLLYNKYRNTTFLYASLICSIIISFFIPEVALRFCKQNFIMWLPTFLLGLVMSRSERINKIRVPKSVCLISFFIFLFLSVYFNSNYYLWLLLPYCSILAILFFVKVFENIVIVDKLLFLLGSYSAAIFVVNPIARTLVMESAAFSSINSTVGRFTWFFIYYILLVAVLSFIYNKVYEYLRNRYI